MRAHEDSWHLEYCGFSLTFVNIDSTETVDRMTSSPREDKHREKGRKLACLMVISDAWRRVKFLLVESD